MLLHAVSFCPRINSVSAQLLEEFKDHWHGEITERDLVDQPVPMLDQEIVNSYIKRNYTGEEIVPPAGLQAWDQALAETQAADVVVVAAPIYNFSLPVPIHAWFDGLIQKGKGWDKIADSYVGCLGPQTFVWLGSCGMVLGEEGNSPYDHPRSWFRQVADFLGASTSHCVLADGQGNKKLAHEFQQRALQEVADLAQALTRRQAI